MDLIAVQGTLKCLLQHQSLKASILWRSAFFVVQFSHPYMTTGKTIALTRQTFVGKVMSLLFNMLSRLIIASLPRSKHLFNFPSLTGLLHSLFLSNGRATFPGTQVEHCDIIFTSLPPLPCKSNQCHILELFLLSFFKNINEPFILE